MSKRGKLKFSLERAAGMPIGYITDDQLDRIIASVKALRKNRRLEGSDWINITQNITKYTGPKHVYASIDFADLNALMDDIEED